MIAVRLGIRKVWFYPQGVENPLSQFNMAACSNWSIEHSTKQYYQTGKHENLYYYVKTKEGHELKFISTTDKLHDLEVDQNTDGYSLEMRSMSMELNLGMLCAM